MKRAPVAIAVAAALAVLTTHPAGAALKKPKPITKTYYFHGANTVGNLDESPANGGLMTMDKTKPTGSSAKEFAFYGLAVSPNTKCGGNSLFPNWVGAASGNIVGKVTVTFWARSTPNASADVRVFPDVTAQACNAAYVDPLAEATVALPASPTPAMVTVTIPVVGKGKVASAITVQVSPGSTAGLIGPQVSGVSYDATAAMSSITFTCLPKKGKKTC